MPGLAEKPYLAEPIKSNIVISQKLCKSDLNIPCLEIRQVISDPELLKYVVLAAYHEVPIMIQPQFSNRLKAIAALIEKGILTFSNGQYYFNF